MNNSFDEKIFISLREDKKNISVKLFEKISRMIIEGEMPPGYVFPNENIMCENLGIARSSLREAYAMLTRQGYIMRTKRGTYVNGLKEIICSTPLSATVKTASRDEYKAFRLMIEGETAKQAAIMASDEEIEDLKMILNKFDAKSSNEEITMNDILFHVRIAELSKNILFRNTIIAVSETWKYGVIEGFTNLKGNDLDLLDQIYSHHKAVFDAIENRKPEEAKKSMISHLNKVL